MTQRFWGTFSILSLLGNFLLLILFLSGVDATEHHRCPESTHSTDQWWTPLKAGHRDPCNLFHKLRENHSLFCCFKSLINSNSTKRDGHHHEDDDKDDKKSCGPCNAQTFNIAATCHACKNFTGNAAPTQVEVERFTHFPSFDVWLANSNRNHTLHLPKWTHVRPTSNGVLDIHQALQAANPKKSGDPKATTVTSPSKPTTSSSAFMQDSKNHHVGAIAGGVIGGIAFLALLIPAIIYVRGRMRQPLAPSMAFIDVRKSIRQAVDPPKFDVRSWCSFSEDKSWRRLSEDTSDHRSDTLPSYYGLKTDPTPWERYEKENIV